ncbi:MAG: heparan-alpha-glucosaminide N-acetyltransferase [archaeon]
MSSSNTRSRFLELDLWRGLAVLAMVGFHFLYDLSFFTQANVDVYSGFWFWFARAVAGSFIFLAGISIPLALHRKKHLNGVSYLVKRGLLLFALGGGITLITFLAFPAYTIWFGVLHALGVCTFLSIFFRDKPVLTFATGVLVWGLGILFTLQVFSTPFWVGIFPVGFNTFDYFPLFPWLGVFLIGMSVSAYWYPHGNARFSFSIPRNQLTSFFAWCGRKSLLIYLAHQPVLIGIVLVGRAFGFF